MMWRGLLFFLMTILASAQVHAAGTPIRIGISPAVLQDQKGAMIDLRAYLKARTGREIELVPRSSHREMFELIRQEKLDFAWVSAYPYLYLQRTLKVRLLVAPLFNGRPFIRAYLIVPAGAGNTNGLLDMEGRFFAYADPDSFTGHYLPRYELRQAGKDSRTFFARTFFAGGQRNVARAVASGLADGAYLHDFAWHDLSEHEPDLAVAVRVAARSDEYGAPPVVASRAASDADIRLLRRALLEMAGDADGAELLKRMHIGGFAVANPDSYSGVDRIMRAMGQP